MQKRDSKRPSQFPPAVATLAIGATSFLGGCGGSDDRPLPLEMNIGTSAPAVAAVSNKCVSGSVRECKVLRGEFQGIQSCFVGVQMCFDSEWGPCGEPEDVLPPGAVLPSPN